MLALLPLALTPLLMAALYKLAAFVMRRTSLSWLHALVGSLLGFVVGATAVLVKVASGVQVAPALSLPVGLALQLSLAGWYLGPRARDGQGETIGFKGGALLALLTYGLVIVLSSVVFVAPLLIARA